MVRKKIVLCCSTILMLVGLSACGSSDVDPRTITVTAELPPSFSCGQGEIRTRTGIDVNQNGLLETSEISSEVISCKVENGLGGDDGFSGGDRPA